MNIFGLQQNHLIQLFCILLCGIEFQQLFFNSNYFIFSTQKKRESAEAATETSDEN